MTLTDSPDLEQRAMLLDEWGQTRREIARLEARSAELLAERMRLFEGDTERNGWGRDAVYRSMVAEYSAAGNVAKGTVENAFADARAIVAEFPAVLETLRDGRITVSHVREITRAGAIVRESVLNGRVPASTLDVFADAAVGIAEADSPMRTRGPLRQVASMLAEETLIERHTRAAGERSVTIEFLDDGLARIVAVLPEYLAVAIHDRLTRMADRIATGRGRKSAEATANGADKARAASAAGSATGSVRSGRPAKRSDVARQGGAAGDAPTDRSGARTMRTTEHSTGDAQDQDGDAIRAGASVDDRMIRQGDRQSGADAAPRGDESPGVDRVPGFDEMWDASVRTDTVPPPWETSPGPDTDAPVTTRSTLPLGGEDTPSLLEALLAEALNGAELFPGFIPDWMIFDTPVDVVIPDAAVNDPRTYDQIRADLFVDLLLAGDVSAVHGEGLDHITGHVQVTIGASTLTGADDHFAELDGHGPLHPDIARDIAAGNTGWTRLFTSPAGMVTETDTYTPTASMRRHLRARDQHCRFPGCTRPAARCDIDHLHDHAKGGPTSLHNLAHLCRGHHIIKHPDLADQSRWTARKHPDGTIVWTSPLGREYTDAAPHRVMFI